MELKDFKNYKRFPIELGGQSIIMIHHFTSVGEGMHQSLEAHSMGEENEAAFEYNYKIFEESAKQFFNQLEGHYCDAFLESLILEATKLLKDSDDRRLSFKKENEKFNSRAKKALDKGYKLINND